ncbi:MAG: SPOR domain-containing protein [Alphaproteobacteria bacterium]|jgi:cell division protein FtsN/cytoskeletal protein RodZ|nr:SPOR domain-containing protein [Alphaproteobacteria bacterium]MDP6590632.1 SPOR domain-containing protein [Alphaproteobacteria bacterium]MDP6818414.1 SPOR domain-containing protein [Alphaproteobacteria bacterium]
MSDIRDPDLEAAEARQVAPGEAPGKAPDSDAPEGQAEAVAAVESRPRARLLPMWILIAAVVIVGAAWAMSERYFDEAEGDKSVPLVSAEDTPVKVRPEEPGGVDVPDRDKYVYKSLTDPEPEAKAEGEQLLPLPEEPMQRPPVEVVELAVPETPTETIEETIEEVAEAEMETAPEPPPLDELKVVELQAPQESPTEAVADSVAEQVEAAPEMAETPAPEAAPEIAPEIATDEPQTDEPQAVEQAVEEAVEPVVAAVEAPEAALEEKKFEQILAPEPAPEPEVQPAAEPEPESEPEAEPAPEPEPEAQPAAAPEAEPEPPAAAIQSAALSADTPGFLVQIGAVQDESAAAGEIARLVKRNPDILAELSSIVVRADLGDKGVWYRMRVGPFATRAAADGVCGQLKAVDVGCFVVAN